MESFKVYQDHVPMGVASMYFGGVIYRFSGNYPDLPLDELKEHLLGTYHLDTYYTVPVTLRTMIGQAKQYGMYFMVNLNEVVKEDILLVPPEQFGVVAGLVADILLENGFTENTSAIALINEPAERWKLNEDQYAKYCQHANKYVKGRLPLVIFNDEYHRFDEKLVFAATKNIPKRIFGIHHLSSLDKDFKNVMYAKTQANEFGVPIICNEGGSWFKPYQSTEGHEINVKLIEECKKYGYLGCAIVCVDVNNQAYNGSLGYRIWNNNYTTIKSQTNWDKFEEVLKGYWKEGEEEMPEERIVKITYPYMYGSDVRQIQKKLLELGYDLGKWGADGVYGSMSERSVYSFKRLTGILGNSETSAVVDKATKNTLMNTPLDEFYPEVFKNIYESSSFSVDAIDYYLYVKAHPDLAGHGKYFVQAEAETGIPAEWQLANGAQESSYKGGGIGSSPVAQKYNNLYGWAVTDSGVKNGASFESFADCILKVAHNIKNYFLDPGNWRYKGDTISGIEYYYSTAPYNAVMKAKYYREICEFLSGPIKHPVPEFVEDLTEYLDNYYVKKD